MRFDCCLFRQNLFSDFFPRFALIRSLGEIYSSGCYSAEHAFVCHDSNCEIVSRNAMILSAHNFGSHISWRSARILRVLRSPDSGDAEVGDSQVAYLRSVRGSTIGVEDEIFGLDVAVDNSVRVDILQSKHDTRYKEL